MTTIKELICSELTVPMKLVDDALRLAYTRYRRIKVPKRSGGFRIIMQPSAELKMIQNWLLGKVFSSFSVSAIATAFEPGKSIVKNASAHRNAAYSVRVDVSDFFPSITVKDLQRVLCADGSPAPSWATEADAIQLITQACFDRRGKLPVGYPSSPRIANLVMFDIDEELLRIVSANADRFGHDATVTRYADDFVFSTSLRGASREFLTEISDLFSKIESPNLRVNSRKTRFMSRARGSTLITGLRVNQQGIVRVHPNYRDHVRLLMKLYSNATLKSEDIEKLRGHLAFVEHADPSFFTKLSFKYYENIAELRT